MLSRQTSKYLPTLLPLIVLLLPRFLGFDRFLWKDELISLQTLKIGILDNPLFFGTTTNLPLFFYLLRLMDVILFAFQNMFALASIPEYLYRILPLIFSLAGGYIAYAFIKTNFGKFASIAFLVLYAFSPLQIYYAQELRPYSLTQLLIILNVIFLHKLIKTREGVLYFSITSLLLILTHYSGYFYLLAQVLILFISFAYYLKQKIVSTYILIPALINVIALFLGLILSYFMMQNPLFSRSIGNLEVGTNWQPLSNPINEAILFFNRVKEVISFYYWYGIYYFSVDSLVQLFFKKLVIIALALGLYFSYKERDKSKANFLYTWYATLLLLASLTVAYLAEKFGYFPFGGRHIMPYSIILYTLFAISLSYLSKFRKVGLIILIVITTLFLSYSYCTYFKLDLLSIETIQGAIFKTCFIQ